MLDVLCGHHYGYKTCLFLDVCYKSFSCSCFNSKFKDLVDKKIPSTHI